MEMSFNGEFEVAIPREEAYDLLVEPNKFIPVLPTYHSMMDKEGGEGIYIVKVKVGIGKIHGIATTEMSLTESSRPVKAEYTGKGNVMGGAYNMITSLELEDTPAGGTLIKWQGTTQIYGKILSLAGGGMRGIAEKEITKVIDSLQTALSSTEAFEAAVAQAQTQVSRGFLATIIDFIVGLFGGAKSDAGIEEDSSKPRLDSEPVHKDTLIPVQPIQHSIDIDGDSKDKWVGQRLRRKEDGRLIRGKGMFVDDAHSSDMLHVGFVRSPYAHAKIVNIDVSAAEKLPGVVTTITGAEVAAQCEPFMQIGPPPGANVKDFGIAVEVVRHQGEPVVVVVANSAREVEDACELVEVEYDVLEAMVSSEDALSDKVLLHEEAGSNITWRGEWNHGDVDKAFAEAAHVVKIGRLHFHRFASTPLETAGSVITWNALGEIDIFCNNGYPPMLAQMLAGHLGVSTEAIRIRTRDVGGNFGTKTVTHPYIALTALASRKAGGRTVKWVEARSDNLAAVHGGERTFLDTEVALDKEGVITGLRSRHLDDCGAFPRYEPLGCVIWSQVYPHTYRLKNINIDFTQVVSNKTPCSPNRGYSRLQHMWFMERVMDICAHELAMPADEIRLRNYIKPEEFPYTTPNGCVYDSGNYPLMLEKAKQLLDWDGWQKKQAEMRAQGRLVGIGIGTTLDSGTNNFGQSYIVNPESVFSGNSEVARIKIDLDGSVVVMLGSAPQGQGHETVAAQTVADDLNISPDMVTVRTGFDSAWNTYNGHSGTIASQFVVTGLSAVHGACEKLKADMKKVSAAFLEANEDDLEFGVGEMGPQVSVKGQPDKALNYWFMSNLVNSNIGLLPEDCRQIDLNIKHTYHPPFEIPDTERKFGNLTLTYAAQLHIAVVEVDSETFQPQILDYAVVDDCGKQINPKIVAGQVHGATAHGIGAAMQEAFQYDEGGNLITSTFTDYAPITSINMPDLKCTHIETLSPFSFNGAKGCGEGGGAPLHTLSSAVQDALHDKGVIITESHNSPSILMEAVKNPNRDSFVSVESRA